MEWKRVSFCEQKGTNVELWKSSFSSSLSHIIEGYFSQRKEKRNIFYVFFHWQRLALFLFHSTQKFAQEKYPWKWIYRSLPCDTILRGVMWCRMRIITCNIANKIYILTIISPSPCSTNAAQHPRNETTRTITASAMRM